VAVRVPLVVNVGKHVLVRVLFLAPGGVLVLVRVLVAVGVAVPGAVVVGVLVDMLVLVHGQPPLLVLCDDL
jgi:hypothetical protein